MSNLIPKLSSVLLGCELILTHILPLHHQESWSQACVAFLPGSHFGPVTMEMWVMQ